MRNALRMYGLLVRLYPRGYREAFGVQMLQTFADYHADVRAAEVHAGMRFWSSLIADELQNLVKQHLAALTEGDGLVKLPVGRVVVTAVIVFPLCALFSGLTVTVALALPHPPVSGVFAIVAIVMVSLVIPGVLGMAVSWVMAGGLLSAWSKRKVAGPSV